MWRHYLPSDVRSDIVPQPFGGSPARLHHRGGHLRTGRPPLEKLSNERRAARGDDRQQPGVYLPLPITRVQLLKRRFSQARRTPPPIRSGDAVLRGPLPLALALRRPGPLVTL